MKIQENLNELANLTQTLKKRIKSYREDLHHPQHYSSLLIYLAEIEDILNKEVEWESLK